MKTKSQKPKPDHAHDTVAVHVIIDMIEEDLILAFDHLQDGLEDLALHQVENARTKIFQIKELKSGAQPARLNPAAAVIDVNAVNAETITVSPHNEPIPDSGSHSPAKGSR